MAFDPDKHAIDPATGFQIDKETGHRVGIDPAPHVPVHDGADWPKWVVAHESHVARKKVDGAPDHVSVPAFPAFHVNRVSGEVTVLVGDEEEEARAVGAAESDGSDPI